jgi:hypothetical protein
MTKLLEKAVEAVRQLSSDSQDEIAEAMLRLATADLDREPVSPADLAAVLKGLEEVRAGHLATEAQIETAFRRFES